MMNTNRTFQIYRNSFWIQIYSEKDYEDNIEDYPHFKLWQKLLNYFKNRDFKIGVNKHVYKHYKILSKNYKVGSKKDLKVNFEINGLGFTLNISNKKNYVEDSSGLIWDDPTDNRHTSLTYIERLQEKIEIYKLKNYLISLGFSYIKGDNELSPEEYIIEKLRENTHIHGKVECLDDIRKSITKDSYDYLYNSNDKNNKKIISGDIKFFYSYKTNRLSRGKVYHNINNMWWVLSSGELYNIACFNLFDYNETLPKKKLASASYIQKLIDKNVKKRNYIKASRIYEKNKSILGEN